MPVPVRMSDLFLSAASNSPSGGDAVGNTLDDYLRAQAGIVRSMRAVSTATIASAATTDLAASDAEYVVVTGTTNITSLGTGFAGCVREVNFQGALTLQHSSTLVLPGAANITTAVNDVMTFRCYDAGGWIMVGGSRANDPLKANLASPALTGTPTVNGFEIGFRGIPQTVQNAAYTFVAGDAGKARVKTDAAAYTYTVAAVHAAGDVLTVLNTGSAGAVTLAGSGVTLQLAGGTTTGNRTLAPGGVCTLVFVSATLALVSGPGLT